MLTSAAKSLNPHNSLIKPHTLPGLRDILKSPDNNLANPGSALVAWVLIRCCRSKPRAAKRGRPPLSTFSPQRVLGTVMGDTSPNHNSNSLYRNPTFYYIGTLDPLGTRLGFSYWVLILGTIQGLYRLQGTVSRYRPRPSNSRQVKNRSQGMFHHYGILEGLDI